MIAIFTETIHKNGGGSQVAAINYAIGLKKLGMEPVIFTIETSYAKEELTKHRLSACLLKPFVLPILTIDLIHAINFLKRNHPKLIMLNESFSTYWVGLICGKIFKIPTFAYFHTFYFRNRETKIQLVNRVFKKIVMLYLRICFKPINYFSVPSKTAAIFLTTELSIPITKIQISPYPVLSEVNAKPTHISDNKQHLKLLYVGRIVKGKNIDLLVKALSYVPTDDWELTIVGSGNFKGDITRIVKDSHIKYRVEMVDFLPRETLLDEYNKYDAFISFSDMETLGFTYIEALNTGLPIICLKYSTTEELFTNFENVYFIESKDPKSMATQLSGIIDQIKLGIPTQTRRSFLEQYTYVSAAQRLISRWF